MAIWELFELNANNLIAIITDRSANIRKTVKDLFGDARSSVCFAHVLLHVVPYALATSPKAINHVITKLRNIAKLVRRSVMAS